MMIGYYPAEGNAETVTIFGMTFRARKPVEVKDETIARRLKSNPWFGEPGDDMDAKRPPPPDPIRKRRAIIRRLTLKGLEFDADYQPINRGGGLMTEGELDKKIAQIAEQIL